MKYPVRFKKKLRRYKYSHHCAWCEDSKLHKRKTQEFTAYEKVLEVLEGLKIN